MEGQELARGLRRWVAPHPDWTPDEGGPDGWDRDVGCVSYETPEALVLFDPLVPEPAEPFWSELDRMVEGAGRSPDVLLTVYWHARSADEILERYGARVWAHEPATERVAERTRFTETFRPGDALPGGVQALDASRAGEVLFWLPPHRALVCGDVLLGAAGGGVRTCPDSWLPDGVTAEDLRASLRHLLELPVEMVLVSHGKPVLADGRAALARALAS